MNLRLFVAGWTLCSLLGNATTQAGDAHYLGRPAADWAEQLSSNDPVVLRRALTALEALESDRAVPAAIEALEHEDPQVVVAAIRSLAAAGLQAKSAAEKLEAIAGQQVDPKLRDSALLPSLESARALWLVTQQAQPARSLLEKGLQGRGRRIARRLLSEVSVALGPRDNPLLPTLVELVRDNPIKKAEGYSNPVADAMVQLGPETCLPALIELIDGGLGGERPDYRDAELFVVLKRFGPAAKPAVASLLKLAHETADTPQEEWLHGQIADTLTAIGKPAMKGVNHLLEQSKPSLQLLGTRVVQALEHRAVEAVPALTSGLQSEDARVRAESALALARIGPPARTALAEVKARLNDDDPVVQVRAIQAQWRITGEKEPAIRLLLDAAKRRMPHPSILIAGEVLAQVGEISKPAQTELNSLLLGHDDQFAAAVTALGGISPTAQQQGILDALERYQQTGAREARILRWMRTGKHWLPFRDHHREATVAALRRQLVADDDQLRWDAMRLLLRMESEQQRVAPAVLARFKIVPVLSRDMEDLLRQLGPAAEPAVPYFLERLELPKLPNSARRDILQVLGDIGPPAERAIPKIASIIREEKRGYTFVIACQALGKLGPAAIPVIDDLAAHAEPRQFDTLRNYAADGFARHAEQSLPALLEAYASGTPRTRHWIAAALEAIGPPAKVAVPMLIESADSAPPAVRIRIAIAVWKITRDGKLAAPLFAKAMQGKPEVFQRYHYWLPELGPAAAPLLPVLDEHWDPQRRPVLTVLNSIGPQAVEFADRVRDAARQGETQAITTIAAIDPDSDATGELLRWALQDRYPSFRVAAVASLGKSGITALPSLRHALRDSDEQVAQAAITALHQLGPAAHAATDDLEHLRDFGSLPLRPLAAQAIIAIHK